VPTDWPPSAAKERRCPSEVTFFFQALNIVLSQRASFYVPLASQLSPEGLKVDRETANARVGTSLERSWPQRGDRLQALALMLESHGRSL
jgi:hypothetical protein